jgi:hypothetical protein
MDLLVLLWWQRFIVVSGAAGVLFWKVQQSGRRMIRFCRPAFAVVLAPHACVWLELYGMPNE